MSQRIATHQSAPQDKETKSMKEEAGMAAQGEVTYTAINDATKVALLMGITGTSICRMAQIHERSGDKVEFGCGPLARKVNLLANMSANGIRTFFSAMADENCPDSNSTIWAQKGVHAAADCAILLRWVAEHERIMQLRKNEYFS